MAKVVFQVIAFGLEHIVILIFDFPAGPAIAHDGFDGGLADLKIGDKGIFVGLFPAILAHDHHFTPIHPQGASFCIQSYLVGKAIGRDFSILAYPAPDNFAFQDLVGGQKSDGLIEIRMRVRLAHQNEMETLVSDGLTEGLTAV